jgi:thiol-disulfide isomerase/thioredoxin
VHKKATADYIGDKGFGESIVSVEASTYEDTVALSEQDVIFDLYAPWCILCARNKPLYEELANRMSKVSIFLLNSAMLLRIFVTYSSTYCTVQCCILLNDAIL